jgi:hypothetical protein
MPGEAARRRGGVVLPKPESESTYLILRISITNHKTNAFQKKRISHLIMSKFSFVSTHREQKEIYTHHRFKNKNPRTTTQTI